MQFTGGDYIAGGMFVLVLLREGRVMMTQTADRASMSATRKAIVAEIGEKVDSALSAITTLETKRQDHELKCAVINERVANTLDRLDAQAVKHDTAIGHLQAQMRNVASGAIGKIIEYPPPDQKPRAR